MNTVSRDAFNKPTRTVRHWISMSLVMFMAMLMGCTPETSGEEDPLRFLHEAWLPSRATQPGGATCTSAMKGQHATFNVGPGQTYSDLQDVPWLALQAGDVVNIFHRDEPYRTRLALQARGTASAPVVINGVTDAHCQRPVISGENARLAFDAARQHVFNDANVGLGTVFISSRYGSPAENKPRFITLRGLKITGASSRLNYLNEQDQPARYAKGAAGIHASVVEHLLIENCEVTGNDNGVFVNTRENKEPLTSRHITLRGNLVHLNGVEGSFLEHNLYIQAAGALYEGNFIGQLVAGGAGSSLKDRSSGTVIRYNHIEAAARAIDLVETDGGATTVAKEANYHQAWVYGNLIISDMNNPGRSSTLLIHWGGDINPELFRHGTLYFYNNTVVMVGSKRQAGVFYVFDMPTAMQRVDARQNIFWRAGSAPFALGYKQGRIELQGPNWISRDWLPGKRGESVVLHTQSPPQEDEYPGLDAFMRPLPQSMSADTGSEAVLSGIPEAGPGMSMLPLFQYAPPGQLQPRSRLGKSMDLGAFEGS